MFMKTIIITLNFLQKPHNSLPYLGFVLLFSAIAIFAISPQFIYELVGFNPVKSLAVLIIPEIITLFIIVILIKVYHIVFKLNQIELTLKGISLYEIKILPLFLFAFIIFFPLTLSMRFLIKYFPNYNFAEFAYLLPHYFSYESYFLYLPSVIILGYLLVNVSLVRDIFSQPNIPFSQNLTQEAAPLENKKNQFLTLLRARGTLGETFLKVADCYYFEATGHGTTIYHAEGKFWLNIRLVHLNNSLDLAFFFKSDPGHIINMAYLESYVYIENGRYALNFKKPVVANLFITKLRKEALKTAFMQFRTL